MQQENSEQEYVDEEVQAKDYYRYIQEQIDDKFHKLTHDTMEEIKTKFRRKQDKVTQQENINLIEQQRDKIATEMRAHHAQCSNSNCIQVEEIIVLYHLFKGTAQKQDPITLIVRPNIKGLPKIETDCFIGAQLNAKMWQTHRLIAGL